MPAQRNASQGNNGCVPFTVRSNTYRRIESDAGERNHATLAPSSTCQNDHRETHQPASAAAIPIVMIHRVASVNRSDAIANIAP